MRTSAPVIAEDPWAALDQPAPAVRHRLAERSPPTMWDFATKRREGDARDDHHDGQRDPDDRERLERQRDADEARATRSAAISPRHRVTSTRSPAKPRSAGSSVSDETAVTATTVAAAAARPVMKRQSHQDHAEQRDDDGRTGERDRPARGIERDDRRVLDGGPLVQVLAVSRHDEQGVVDADTQAEHERDRGGEVGDRQEVGEQPGEDRSDADAGEGDADGQAHREHGPERQDQHDDGEGQAEQLRARNLELGEDARRRARSARPWISGISSRISSLIAVASSKRDVARQPDLGVRDEPRLGALGGDLLGALRRVRARQRDAFDLADLDRRTQPWPAGRRGR